MPPGAYFTFSQPTLNTKWQNNDVNELSWTKGKLDGVDTFDIEFTRMSVNGNWEVAKGRKLPILATSYFCSGPRY